MKGKDMTYSYRIAACILAHIRGVISPEQQERLEEWLEESETHRMLFARICDEHLQGKEIAELLSYNTGLAWVKVKQRVERRRQRRMFNYIKLAASVVLVLGLCSVIRYKIAQRSEVVLVKSAPIAPGHYRARLTFASGKSFIIDSLTDVQLCRDTVCVSDDSAAVAGNDSSIPDCRLPVAYNKLEIPRGGEYRVVLADGTEVYLNSATELRFPEDFKNSKERVVYLSGEAFFKVAKNEKQPFIVKCGDYDVKVLGTTFNISNYRDDRTEHTTLASGKVEIGFSGRKVTLKPGQQARIEGENLNVKKVNVENYTSWMNAYFRFEGENIDRILKRLSRWYDVEIFYLNPSVKNYHFSGYLPRYVNISEVLDLLSMTTDVKFEVKNRSVVVMKK